MELLPRLAIFLLLFLILGSLAGGMFRLAKQQGERNDTGVVRALTFRIVLSLLLFVFLIGGYFLGYIEPHGLVQSQ